MLFFNSPRTHTIQISAMNQQQKKLRLIEKKLKMKKKREKENLN